MSEASERVWAAFLARPWWERFAFRLLDYDFIDFQRWYDPYGPRS